MLPTCAQVACSYHYQLILEVDFNHWPLIVPGPGSEVCGLSQQDRERWLTAPLWGMGGGPGGIHVAALLR